MQTTKPGYMSSNASQNLTSVLWRCICAHMCSHIHKHAHKQKRDRGGGGVAICGVIRLDFAGFVKKTLHSLLYPTKKNRSRTQNFEDQIIGTIADKTRWEDWWKWLLCKVTWPSCFFFKLEKLSLLNKISILLFMVAMSVLPRFPITETTSKPKCVFSASASLPRTQRKLVLARPVLVPKKSERSFQVCCSCA